TGREGEKFDPPHTQREKTRAVDRCRPECRKARRHLEAHSTLESCVIRIIAVEVYPLILPVAEVYGGAAGTLEDCRALIVRVETEDGIEGWGEATQGRPGNTYETLETMEIMVRRYFGPALIGMDLEGTGSVLQTLHQIRSGHPLTKAALEIALFDALGKWYRVPLYRFLGGPYRRGGGVVCGGGVGFGAGDDGGGADQRLAGGVAS